VYCLPRLADERRMHRRLATLILLVSGGAAFVFPTAGPRVGILALSIAVSGFISVQPIFWTFPTAYLADVAAAGGIALIGTGNVGGFLAPNLKVWADEHFHSPSAGLYVLAGLTVVNAVMIATLRQRKTRSD
jgi:nitrate/nitrite transporter NarK